jgi:transketolase
MGHHAGISVGPDGATHQMTEDIALMRAMPNMTVIVPCDAMEAEKAVLAAAHIVGPVYIRFAREKSPVFTTESSPFTPNKAQVVWESHKPQVVIIACGPLLYNALQAARLLERENIQSVVLNVHTIKPLDEKKITDLAKKYGAVVTVEEHQIAGGLGGAVAELLARTHPVPMEFIGMHNVFGSSGAPEKLSVKYGMDVPAIVVAVKKAVARK